MQADRSRESTSAPSELEAPAPRQGPELEVRVLERIDAVAARDWDALLPPDAAPFLRFDFLRALERSGCVGPAHGWVPSHLALFEGDRLFAAAPAYIKDNSEGEFVFDWGFADLAERMHVGYYPKLVVAVPFTPATGHRIVAPNAEARARATPLVAAKARDLLSSGSAFGVHVLFPTEGETALLEAQDFAPRHGIQFHWNNDGFRTFDDWLATFDAKRRAQIRRERREVRARGIRVETLRGDAITEEVLDAMYRFYRSTVDKYPWGRRYLNRAFFADVAERMADALEIVTARQGDRIVAGALNFASPSVLYGRYWGADEDIPFLHFEVCYYHSVEDAIARRLARFEPGAGGEHKRVRGFRPSITYSAHLFAHAKLDRVLRSYLAAESEQVRRVLAGEADGDSVLT